MSYREYSIFYSWQSDADHQYNWDFIGTALKAAVDKIKARQGFDIPIVDSGMERVGGSPEVATIMFDKIKRAAIFIGDVSLVGKIKQVANKPTKKTANPNVLMEMAYAGAKLGWERVVCVMNTMFGRPEKLPVDIRNRRFPIRYKFGPDNQSEIGTIQAELTNDFEKAIDAILYRDSQSVIEAEGRFDVHCINMITAMRNCPYFFTPPPNQFTAGAANGLDTPSINAAVSRLLDLGLIECDFDSSENRYAYHWTFLGRMYIRKKWLNDTPAWITEIDRQSPAAGYTKHVDEG